MFIPGTNHHERNEKCTLGVTALLTLAILLLMIGDMMPHSPVDQFPLLGGGDRLQTGPALDVVDL